VLAARSRDRAEEDAGDESQLRFGAPQRRPLAGASGTASAFEVRVARRAIARSRGRRRRRRDARPRRPMLQLTSLDPVGQSHERASLMAREALGARLRAKSHGRRSRVRADAYPPRAPPRCREPVWRGDARHAMARPRARPSRFEFGAYGAKAGGRSAVAVSVRCPGVRGAGTPRPAQSHPQGPVRPPSRSGKCLCQHSNAPEAKSSGIGRFQQKAYKLRRWQPPGSIAEAFLIV
jgi:hypothetical protein